LSLYKANSQTHPIFIGPAMIHKKKDYNTFYYFAQRLVEYDHLNYSKPEFSVKNIKLFVTDDDPAIHGSFKECFPKSTFILCCNHIQMNVLKEFENYEIEKKDKDTLMAAIFGHTKNRKNCLISSKSSDEYEERLNILLDEFQNFKHKSKNNYTFRDYFEKNKANKIYESVVVPSWAYPEFMDAYQTTNDVECSHTSVKSHFETLKTNEVTDVTRTFESKTYFIFNYSELRLISTEKTDFIKTENK
jgi:hypothetical protein